MFKRQIIKNKILGAAQTLRIESDLIIKICKNDKENKILSLFLLVIIIDKG